MTHKLDDSTQKLLGDVPRQNHQIYSLIPIVGLEVRKRIHYNCIYIPIAHFVQIDPSKKQISIVKG